MSEHYPQAEEYADKAVKGSSKTVVYSKEVVKSALAEAWTAGCDEALGKGEKWVLECEAPIEVVLYTNRSCSIFSLKGEHIVELQQAITCYALDANMAYRIANHASMFYLSKWGAWKEKITREEFLYLLGLGVLVRPVKLIG